MCVCTYFLIVLISITFVSIVLYNYIVQRRVLVIFSLGSIPIKLLKDLLLLL